MAKQRTYKDFTFMANTMFQTLGYDLMDSPRPWWQKLLLRSYFLLCIVSNCYEACFVTYRILQWESVAGSPSKIMRQALHFFYMFSAQLKFVTFMKYRKELRLLNQKLKDLYPSSEIFMALGPLLQSCIVYLIRYGKVEFLYLRIFPTQLSFNTENPLGYVLGYVIDFTYSQFIVNVSLGTDLWMMCVSSQISMHFAYLAKILGEYCPSEEKEQLDCQFLASLVRRHQVILSLHKDLNRVFGLLLASNLFITASLLCCMAFYTVVEGLNTEGISYMMLFASVAAQFYMVSSYGQMLIDLSANIALAAYEHKWYEGGLRYRKDLVFVMARAQRPTEISAKGIIIISFDTFKTLMSITYRFYAVIRQIVGK
ncbi:odorant receptor 49a isoform X2 [Drosophila kikkawai]|uniref:Odorant receptor n=1 Tax=Drosophila kikkawai TaxID=30033 RepID=A0ABM4GBT0_DROKI